MFPIDKRFAQAVWYPAPDVVPNVCFAVDDVPVDLWNEHTELDALADAIMPYLERRGASRWDFIWSMERHFSEPYGPLPKAGQTIMAGIPDMFLPSQEGPSDSSVHDTAGGVLGEQAHLNVARQQDGLEVQAQPFQYEADSEMPEEYRFWLEKIFFAHGECMMPYFGAQSKGHKDKFSEIDAFMLQASPSPEARLRVSNFTAEEFKHLYQFYKVYSEFDADIPVRIYEHEREVFRAYESYQSEPTWVDHAIFNMMGDRFGVYQGFEWVQSSYAPLARLALKVVKDERGHANFGYLNLRDELDVTGDEGRKLAQKRIDEYFYPYFMAFFGAPDSQNNRMWRSWGLKQHTNGQLRLAYHEEMQLVLENLGMEAPDLEQATARGMEEAQKMKAATGGITA